MESDGTNEGRYTQVEVTNANLEFEDALTDVDIWVTVPWPVLHVSLEIPLQAGASLLTLSFYIAKNLIGIEDQSLQIEGDGSWYEFFPDIWAALQENVLCAAVLPTLIVLGNVVEAVRTNPVALGLSLAAMVAVCIYTWLSCCSTARDQTESGEWANIHAAIFLIECAMVFLLPAFHAYRNDAIGSWDEFGEIEITDDYEVVSGFTDWLKWSQTAFIAIVCLGAALLAVGIFYLALSF